MKYHTQKELCTPTENKRLHCVLFLCSGKTCQRQSSEEGVSEGRMCLSSDWNQLIQDCETYESRLMRGVHLFVNAMWPIYCRLLLQGAHHPMTAALENEHIFSRKVNFTKNKLTFSVAMTFTVEIWIFERSQYCYLYWIFYLLYVLIYKRVFCLVFTIKCLNDIFHWVMIDSHSFLIVNLNHEDPC